MKISKPITLAIYPGEQFVFCITHYAVGGNTAVQVINQDGSPWCTLSTNVKEVHLPHDQFFLKDWSENFDFARALVSEGFIKPAPNAAMVMSGHVWVEAHVFTDKVQWEGSPK